MTTTVPCRAKDPRTCAYHGNLINADEANVRADAALKTGDMAAYMTARDEVVAYTSAANQAAATTAEVHAFFETRAHIPLTVPRTGSPYQTVNYLPAGTRLVSKVVTTQGQLRAAVENTAGVRGRENVRQVVATMPAKHFFRNHTAPETLIAGPRDGRPIVVELDKCATDLRVNSGTALINATSPYGGSVKVGGQAMATIITPPGKIHIDANGDSRVTVVPRPGARGSIWVGKDAEVEIVEIPGVTHELRIHRGDNRNIS